MSDVSKDNAPGAPKNDGPTDETCHSFEVEGEPIEKKLSEFPRLRGLAKEFRDRGFVVVTHLKHLRRKDVDDLKEKHPNEAEYLQELYEAESSYAQKDKAEEGKKDADEEKSVAKKLEAYPRLASLAAEFDAKGYGTADKLKYLKKKDVDDLKEKHPNEAEYLQELYEAESSYAQKDKAEEGKKEADEEKSVAKKLEAYPRLASLAAEFDAKGYGTADKLKYLKKKDVDDLKEKHPNEAEYLQELYEAESSYAQKDKADQKTAEDEKKANEAKATTNAEDIRTKTKAARGEIRTDETAKELHVRLKTGQEKADGHGESDAFIKRTKADTADNITHSGSGEKYKPVDVYRKANNANATRGFLDIPSPEHSFVQRHIAVSVVSDDKVDFLGQSADSSIDLQEFESKEEKETFFREIERYGTKWAVTAKGLYSGVAVSGGVSRGTSVENDTHKSKKDKAQYYCKTVLSHMNCQSFEIAESSLCLHPDARLDAEKITKDNDDTTRKNRAREWLMKYGSHVYRNFHVGGIFSLSVYATATSSSEKEVLRTAVAKNLATEVGVSGIVYGVGVSTEHTDDNATENETTSSTFAHMTNTNVKRIGGPQEVIKEPEWRKGIVDDNRTWKLTKCDTSYPLWDIIEREVNQETADYVKREFHSLKYGAKVPVPLDIQEFNNTVRALEEQCLSPELVVSESINAVQLVISSITHGIAEFGRDHPGQNLLAGLLQRARFVDFCDAVRKRWSSNVLIQRQLLLFFPPGTISEVNRLGTRLPERIIEWIAKMKTQEKELVGIVPDIETPVTVAAFAAFLLMCAECTDVPLDKLRIAVLNESVRAVRESREDWPVSVVAALQTELLHLNVDVTYPNVNLDRVRLNQAGMKSMANHLLLVQSRDAAAAEKEDGEKADWSAFNEAMGKLSHRTVVSCQSSGDERIPPVRSEFKVLMDALDLREALPLLSKMSHFVVLDAGAPRPIPTSPPLSIVEVLLQCLRHRQDPFPILAAELRKHAREGRARAGEVASVGEENDFLAMFGSDGDAASENDADAAPVQDGAEEQLNALDVLYATIACSGPSMRQSIWEHLHAMNVALPLFFAEPFVPSGARGAVRVEMCSSWFRSLSLRWKVGGSSCEASLGKGTDFPLVAVVNASMGATGKTQMMNNLTRRGESGPFLSRDSYGATSPSLFKQSLGELAWMPMGALSKDESMSEHPDCNLPVLLLNVHGLFDRYPEEVRSYVLRVATTVLVIAKSDDMRVAVESVRGMMQLARKTCPARAGTSPTWCSNMIMWVKDVPDGKESMQKVGGVLSAAKIQPASFVLTRSSDATPGVLEKLRSKIYAAVSKAKTVAASEQRNPLFPKTGLTDSENADVDIIIAGITDPVEYKRNVLPMQGRGMFARLAASKLAACRAAGRASSVVDFETTQVQHEATIKAVRQAQLAHLRDVFAAKGDHPLRAFVRLATLPDAEARRRTAIFLRQSIDENTRDSILRLRDQVFDSGEALNKAKAPEQPDTKKISELTRQVTLAKEAYDSAALGLEHFWRELGQAYEAMASPWAPSPLSAGDDKEAGIGDGGHGDLEHPGSFSKLAKGFANAAAQLLIDGSALEIMDGDASFVPSAWVSEVTQSLRQALHEQREGDRVIVISILGLQSTGKSTLLNALFGVSFAVSMGRCTRGVYMQLVRVKPTTAGFGSRYDWAIIVDTEGLRSDPSGSDESIARDNRMGAFALAISDMCILNMSGGDSFSQEVRDVVMLSVRALITAKDIELSNTSMVAVHHGMNAVDAADKLKEQCAREMTELDKITEEISASLDLRIHRFCDIVKFGTDHIFYFRQLLNHAGGVPVPSPDYSCDAQRLLQFLVDKSHGSGNIATFGARVNIAWQAVINADFLLNLRSIVEWNVFKEVEKATELALDVPTASTEKKLRELLSSLGEKDLQPEELVIAKTLLLKQWDDFVAAQCQAAQSDMAAFFESNQGNSYTRWKEDHTRGPSVRIESTFRSIHTSGVQSVETKCAMLSVQSRVEQLEKSVEAKVMKSKGEFKKDNELMSKDEIRKLLNQEIARHRTAATIDVWQECIATYRKELVGTTFENKFSDLLYDSSGQRRAVADPNELMDPERLCEAVAPSNALKKIFGGFLKGKARSAVERFTQTVRDALCAELINKVLEPLQDGSEAIVVSNASRRCIALTALHISRTSTDPAFEDWVFKDDFKAGVHAYVCISTVYPQLRDTQLAWEKKYSLAARLEERADTVVERIHLRLQGVNLTGFAAQTLAKHVRDKATVASQAFYQSLVSNKIKEYNWAKNRAVLCTAMYCKSLKCLNANNLTFVKDRVLHPQSALRTVQSELIDGAMTKSGIDKSKTQATFLESIRAAVLHAVNEADASQSQEDPLTMKRVCAKIESTFDTKVNEELGLQKISSDTEITQLTQFLTSFSESLKVVEFGTISDAKTKKHVVSAQSGLLSECETCPFCKCFCTQTGSGHETHIGAHQPQGLGGMKDAESRKLVTSTCACSIISNERFKTSKTNEKYVPYSEYKSIYPHWIIQTTDDSNNNEPKILMSQIGSKIAEWYGCNPPAEEGSGDRSSLILPAAWRDIDIVSNIAALEQHGENSPDGYCTYCVVDSKRCVHVSDS